MPNSKQSSRLIAITGSIGSGKSAVGTLLKQLGFDVIEADVFGSSGRCSSVSAGLRAVVDEFGPEVLTAKENLDRAKLAALVFSDTERRRRLEAIIHPLVFAEFQNLVQALRQAGRQLIFYEVPLLFESQLPRDIFDVVIVVRASEELCTSRIVPPG